MTLGDTLFGRLSPREIALDKAELKRRLGEGAEEALARYRSLSDGLFSECDIKYAVTEAELSVDGECSTVGGVKIPSRSLSKMLSGCEGAYILALTLGVGVDRFIKRATSVSITEGVVADALASTLADGVCYEVIKRHLGDIRHTPPFAPGYGDSGIECLPHLLKKADGTGYLGIDMTASKLMLPTKSIIVIVGKM